MTDREDSFTVLVPATSSNLGPGFDALGLALDWRDEYTFTVSDEAFVHVEGEAAGETPTDKSNYVLAAALKYSGRLGHQFRHLHVSEISRIPVSRGLGSSTAAVVAGLAAARHNAGLDLHVPDIAAEAVEIEGHPDNVIPALVGGLTAVAMGAAGPVWAKAPFPEEIRIAIAVPETRIETSRARAVLPDRIPFEDAVFNVSRAGVLVAALQNKQYAAVREAMRDRLHQPYRAPLHPALDRMIDAALDSGALGAALSGSGSSVIALVHGDSKAAADAMRDACLLADVECRSFSMTVASEGVRVLPG